jgi:hypothetical protein
VPMFCGANARRIYRSSRYFVRELQGLKPPNKCRPNIAAEAATHKAFRLATLVHESDSPA